MEGLPNDSSTLPQLPSTVDGYSQQLKVKLTSLEIALDPASFDFNFSSVASCLALTSAVATATWFSAVEPREMAEFCCTENAETEEVDDVTAAIAAKLHRRRILFLYYYYYILLIREERRK